MRVLVGRGEAPGLARRTRGLASLYTGWAYDQPGVVADLPITRGELAARCQCHAGTDGLGRRRPRVASTWPMTVSKSLVSSRRARRSLYQSSTMTRESGSGSP